MGDNESAFGNGGRFEVIRELGRGGMGAVYEVYDRERDERVALKALLRSDAAGIDRFRREFRTLKSLDHPSLVKLYELVSAEGQWFFTMELLNGCDFLSHVRGSDLTPPSITWPPTPTGLSVTLGDPALLPPPATLPEPLTTMPMGAVARPSALAMPLNVPTPVRVRLANPPKPPDYERLRETLLQLASGLLYLHDRDKLHRDIKPSNVMVTAEKRAVLLDFGLVTDLSPSAIDRSSLASLAGTPLYMSPEHATGQLLTMASDWYCVGLMMYKALTGLVPHEEYAGNVFQLLLMRQQKAPMPPSELEPSVPPDLDALCLRLLLRDPAGRPSGREVVEHLGRTRAVSTSTPTPAAAQVEPPAFVGRGGELAALRESLREARGGKAVVVSVLGQSGVGKSRLVQRFLEEVTRGDGAIVLTGRCWEGESVPYKATVGLVDNLRRYLRQIAHGPGGEPAVERLLPRDVWALARLFPSLQRVEAVARAPRRAGEGAEPRELRRRAFAAARELFARMSDQALVVVHVDDLQWGDRDSAELLTEVLRGPGAPPLCVVLTCRSGDHEKSSFFRALLSDVGEAPGGPSRRTIEVGPLPRQDAEELAQRLLLAGGAGGAGSEAMARAIALESGGSPIFLQQLACDVEDRPDGPRSEGRPDGLSFGEPTLEHVLLKRLRRLPDEARRLMELVAVARHPVSERVAGYAAEVSGRGRASLELLHAERLIRTCAEERGFIEAYHDRVREIVLAHIGEEDRVAYHERLALALESSKHADPEVIAAHLRAARRFEDAGRHALEAARRAEGALAFDRAVRLYRFALECRPDAARARELRAKLGRALANAGRSSEAAEAYLSAIEGAPPDEGRTLRMLAAERYLAGGRMDEGYEVLRTLLETLGLGMPRSRQGAVLRLVALRARMRLRGTNFRRRDEATLPAAELSRIDACWSIANAIGNLDTTRGLYFHGLNFLQALDAGEPYRVGRALSAEAAYGFILGLRSRSEAAELLARGRQLAEEFDRPYLLGVSFVHEGMIAFLGEEQWQKTWELCQRGEAILRSHGTDVSYELTVAELYASNSLLFRGELAALASRLGPALERAQDRQDLFAECYVRLRCGPLVNLAADRPDRVWNDLELLRERLRTREYYLQHYWRVHAEAQALLYSARPGAAAEAVARLDDEWPRLEPFLRTRFHRVDAHDLRARALLSAAARGELDLRSMLKRAAADALTIEKAEMPRSAPISRCLRAGIAALRGEAGDAADLLHAASEGFDRIGMGLHAEAARRRRGELRGERGRAAIDEAEAWMGGQGVKAPRRMTALLVPGFRLD